MQRHCYTSDMKVLVTGGAGYIGSHTLIELLAHDYTPTVIDNLCNSNQESLKRVEEITGKRVPLFKFDVRDTQQLDTLFAENAFDAVIHFAGLKAVGESVKEPLAYYGNNLDSTMNLLSVMQKYGVKRLIFSSSATVYGEPDALPIEETSQTGLNITNPYGQTKYMLEQILQDVVRADNTMQLCILRYFNPIGAHESGLIGEDPNGIPNNLMPYVAQVAVGERDHVTIHGNDYDTLDGTGVRDYIHVVDIAQGHLAALQHLQPGTAIYNLGTGHGTSVLELIQAFSVACGHDITYEIGPRREGDLPACYASAEKAAIDLEWRARKTIADACKDTWNWQTKNPHGYST